MSKYIGNLWKVTKFRPVTAMIVQAAVNIIPALIKFDKKEKSHTFFYKHHEKTHISYLKIYMAGQYLGAFLAALVLWGEYADVIKLAEATQVSGYQLY